MHDKTEKSVASKQPLLQQGGQVRENAWRGRKAGWGQLTQGLTARGKKFKFHSKGNGKSVMMGFKQGNDNLPSRL